jgi:superoxide dismutase, Fe-Mn family
VKRSEVKKIISDTLGLGKAGEDLTEAYVASVKSYDLPTELLSEKAKAAHKRLYEDYVQTLNEVSARLDTVDRQGAASGASAYRSLKLDETYNLNAVWLHELFFANISDLHSEIMADSLAFMRLERDWGNFTDWQFDFMACAMSARDGWAVCGYDMYLQRYINTLIDQHSLSVPVGLYPVIVMDMHEHAEFRDYLDDKKSYLIGMMRQLQWGIIEERFKRAERIAEAFK